MKAHQIFIVALLSIGCAGAAAENRKLPQLSDESRAAIREASREHGYAHAITALLPEEKKGVPVDIAAVPEKVRQHAIYWIRKTMAAEWLPEGIESRLSALKDARAFETKDLYGGKELEADYVLLEYEFGGFAFHLQDSGEGLTVRIDLSNEIDLRGNPTQQLRDLLLKFFRIPASETAIQDLKIARRSSMYLLSSKKRPTWKADDASNTIVEAYWWEPLRAISDGRTLIVSFTEVEPGGRARKSRLNFPDRF